MKFLPNIYDISVASTLLKELRQCGPAKVEMKMHILFGSDLDVPVRNSLQGSFDNLANLFQKEKHLLSAKGKSLFKSFLADEAVCVFSPDMNILGYTRLTHLCTRPEGEWYELGGSWVSPNARGMGICEKMYQRLLPAHSDKLILATTTNLAAVSVGKKLGFVTVPRKKLPEQVWKASCTCPSGKTGVPAGLSFACKRANGEPQCTMGPCFFRVTEETVAKIL